MSEDDAFSDEVMDTVEEARPHHREHAKAEPRPDEDELEHRLPTSNGMK